MINEGQDGTGDIGNMEYILGERKRIHGNVRRVPQEARSQDRSSRASLHPNVHNRQYKPVLDGLV